MIEYSKDFEYREEEPVFKNIENLKIENIHKGSAKKRSSVVGRKSNSFVLRTSGCVRYAFKDASFDVHPGEIMFLPQGATYDFISLTESPCEYVAIRFEADLLDATPSAYSVDGFADADEFKNNLADLWKFGGRSDVYKCYSIFYNLLAYLENLENLSYIEKKKVNIIAPAIDYLKTHIYDCDLSAETLHRLCGISGTYFRKIFQSYYAVSPQKYILGKRLSHAKILIDNGDFDTISDLAASVGYSDPLYFSRAFKKKYGISPSKYTKG